MSSMVEYLPFIFGGCLILLGVIVFHKYRKPAKKEFLLTRETSFNKGEGPKIVYDVGLGGSPYDGRVLELKENGDKANVVLENEDGTSIELTNLSTGENGNLKMVSSFRELLHGEIKMLCNKDATGQVNVLSDGSNWTVADKSENRVVVDLLAEARAHARAIDDVDDLIQYKSLRRKQRGYSAPASEVADEEEPVAISKFG